MSVALIEVLYATTKRPGMPLCARYEDALSDRRKGPSKNVARGAESHSSKGSSAQTDLVEVEGLERAEGSTPTAGQAEILANSTEENDPDLWLYRDRTVALLRRYMRLSMEVGRLPSLLGREFFRTRVTSYKASTFEDAVIFVHDVERSLEELDEFEKRLIEKIVLQQYSQEEAGRLLGCGYRTVERLFPKALDRVSEIFLRREIMTALTGIKDEEPKSCQGGKGGAISRKRMNTIKI